MATTAGYIKLPSPPFAYRITVTVDFTVVVIHCELLCIPEVVVVNHSLSVLNAVMYCMHAVREFF